MAAGVLTVTGENLWLGPCRLADHDRGGRVVLLHRGVRACEKRSISSTKSANILNCLHTCAACIQLHPGRNGGSRKTTELEWGESDLVALLVSPVWHSRNRTSLRPLVNAYLPDMVISCMLEDSSWRSCYLQFRFTKLLIRRRINVVPSRAQTPGLCNISN